MCEHVQFISKIEAKNKLISHNPGKAQFVSVIQLYIEYPEEKNVPTTIDILPVQVLNMLDPT